MCSPLVPPLTSVSSLWFSLFFQRYRYHRHLHSFPTRRSSDLVEAPADLADRTFDLLVVGGGINGAAIARDEEDRKSTRLNSSHSQSSYAVFCLKKKNAEPSARVVRALQPLRT